MKEKKQNISATDKALELFADMLISKIESFNGDWKKPWFSNAVNAMPRNLSGRYYNGGNSFCLMMKQEMEGYELPVWGTFDRITSLNFTKDKQGAKTACTDVDGNELPRVSVTKGEKSFPVLLTCFTCVNPTTKEKIKYSDYMELSNDDKSKYNVYPSIQVYHVFNIAQTNIKDARPGLYAQLKKECGVSDEVVNEEYKASHPTIDYMIDNNLFLCPINLVKGDDAYYSISKDSITLPLREQFKSGESFASNSLHEMAHACGAEGRLNRLKPTSFGSNEYAREELIAEMTAALVGTHFGLSKHLKEDSAAYLKSWLNNLKEDTSYIKTILNDVKKCASMLEGRINAIDAELKAKDMVEFINFSFDEYHQTKTKTKTA